MVIVRLISYFSGTTLFSHTKVWTNQKLRVQMNSFKQFLRGHPSTLQNPPPEVKPTDPPLPIPDPQAFPRRNVGTPDPPPFRQICD
jgi:hypothetical protein